MVNCVISFDNNPQGIYYSGQTIYGTIKIVCDKPKKIEELILKLQGFAHVHWEEQRSTTSTDSNGNSTTTTTTDSYDGHEDYINGKSWLLKNGTKTVLEPGTHTFTFTCKIPPNCPSSFVSLHGVIKYFAKVVLVRPWKFNQSFTKNFTVLKTMDLNRMDPLIKAFSEFSVVKKFGVWPFSSEPLLVKAKIPQTGFVPGQKIPVTLYFHNQSNVSISELRARLMMIVTYYSTRPKSKTQTYTKVQKIIGPPIPKRSKDVLYLSVPVPTTPSTCIYSCSIINIRYELNIEFVSKGMHTNPTGKMGVVIGNIPLIQAPSTSLPPRYPEAFAPLLRESDQPMPSSSSAAAKQAEASSSSLQAQSISSSEAEGLPSYSGAAAAMGPSPDIPNLPPPSYEEAMHVLQGTNDEKEDGGEDYGDRTFRPIYPTYNNIPSPSAPPIDDISKSFANASLKDKK